MSDLEGQQPHIVKNIPDDLRAQQYAPSATVQQASPIYTGEPVTEYPMPYATAQQINGGYAIRGIVVPHDGRQPIFNDDMLVEVIPASRANQVVIMNAPAAAVPTVCTSTSPQLFFCVNDNKTLVSQVRYKRDFGGLVCWIILFILLFPFSLFFLLCMPFGNEVAIHYCPQCGRQVGVVPTALL